MAKKRKRKSFTFSKKKVKGKKPRKKIFKPVRKAGRVKTKKKIRKTTKPKKKIRKVAKRVARARLKTVKAKTKRFSVDPTIHRTKIRVIGIGGGGGSIISEIASQVKRTDFVAANTDSRALRELARPVKRFQFGRNLTGGLGTGMNVELGEMAAQTDKEKIKKLLEGQDLCIIVACLGGGTGSGATPIFAQTCKKIGNLAYGIFTLPFEFEGEKKMEIAKEALEKIKPYLNAFSIIPNERIFQIIDKNAPLKNALSAINKRLAENLGGLIETIYSPGLINIDFADLKTIFTGRGRVAYLNTIEIDEPDKEEATKKLVSSPLYPYTIKGARGILYNITSGKNLQLSEVSQISKIVSEAANKRAKIIFGISQSQKSQDKIKITLLATGCGMKGFLRKPDSSKESSVPEAQKTKSEPTSSETKKKKKRKRAGKSPEVKSSKKVKSSSETEPKPEPKSKMKLNSRSRTKPKAKARIGSEKKKALSQEETKVKIRVKKEKTEPARVEKIEKEIAPKILEAPEQGKTEVSVRQNFGEKEKIRRNGLQVKKAIEEEEKEILEQEKFWETPAIFRRKMNGK